MTTSGPAPKFSFDPVDETMEVLCCVGPERSWSVLSNFIANAQGRMVSSIYEFHAEHIADAIEERLSDGVEDGSGDGQRHPGHRGGGQGPATSIARPFSGNGRTNSISTASTRRRA